MDIIGKTIGGSYRIAGQIGADRFSARYRACPAGGGEAVDVTVFRADSVSTRVEDAIRFRSEMAMVRGFDHPAILRVIDFGELFGMPYVITASRGDQALADTLRKGPLAAGDVVRYAVDLCRALEYAHERGIVHKSIRPGNVFLRGPGESKGVKAAGGKEPGGEALLDGFGLAHLIELAGQFGPEERMELFGYLAPEQTGLFRRRVDERTDLYLLGVLLYHMTTGRMPVTGDSVTSMVHRHLTVVPDPPSRLVNRQPVMLDRIIMRLLEKEPDRRYQGTKGLRADLERVFRGDTDFIPGLEDHTLRVELFGPMTGREREIDRLKRLFAVTRGGRCTLCVVTGPIGSGKTRLIEEFKYHVYETGGAVIEGRCVSRESVKPYGPLAEALGGYVRRFGTYPEEKAASMRDRAAREFSGVGGLLTKLSPAIAAIIGEPGPVEAVRINHEAARFNVIAARLLGFLGDSEKGLVLVIEEAHWSDDETLAILAEAASTQVDHPLMIVLTAGIGSEHANGVGRMLESGPGDGTTREHISLAAFDEGMHALFVSRLLRDDGDDVQTLARHVYPLSRGIPLVAIGLVERCIAAGAVRYGGGRWTVDRDRLASLEDATEDEAVLQGRLEDLDEASCSILSVAAVIGRSFSPDLVAAVCGIDIGRVLEAVDHAEKRYIVEADRQSRGAYSFMHDRIRDALSGMPGAERRREIHRKTAETLISMRAHETDEGLFDIAHHAIEAAEKEMISRWACEAGMRARERYALESAGRYLQEVIRSIDRPVGESHRALFVRCTVEVGELQIITGRIDAGIETLQAVLPLITDTADRAAVYRHLADACYRRGDWLGCEENSARGLDLLGEVLPRSRGAVAAGIVRGLFGHVAHAALPFALARRVPRTDTRRFRDILRFYEPLAMTYALNDKIKLVRLVLRVLNIAERRVGPSAELALAYYGYASMCMAIPLFGRSLRYHERGLALNESLGHEGGVAKNCELLGYFHEWTGDYTAAALYFGRALDIYRRLGDAKEYAMVLNGLVHCRYYSGDYRGALEMNRRYRASAEEADDAYAVSAADIYYSQVYREQGDLVAADRSAESARDLSRARNIPFNYCSSLIELGMNALERGEPGAAIGYLAEARVLIERGDFLKQYVILLYPALAQARLDDYLQREHELSAAERARCLKRVRRLARLAARKTRRWVTHHGGSLRVLARCHAVMGNRSKAVSHFEKSIAACRRTCRRFETARGLYDYGVSLAQAGEDRASRERLEEAYRIFSDIGSVLHAARTALMLGIREDGGRVSALKEVMGRERAQAAARIGREIAACATEETLLDLITSRSVEMTGAQGCSLYLGDPADEACSPRFERGALPAGSTRHRMTAASAFSGDGARWDSGPETGHGAADAENRGDSITGSVLCVPIRDAGGVVGACCVEGGPGSMPFTAEDADFLIDILGVAAIRLRAGFGAVARKRDRKDGAVTPGTEEKLQSVISYIAGNYHDNLSREGLAAMAGMSPNHLGKYFAIYTGKKIGDHINELRIKDAAKRLIETNENIIDIAYSVGFESLRTFNRAFLKVYTTTPTEFRVKK